MKHAYGYWHGLRVCQRCGYTKPIKGSLRAETECVASDTPKTLECAESAPEGLPEAVE